MNCAWPTVELVSIPEAWMVDALIEYAEMYTDEDQAEMLARRRCHRELRKIIDARSLAKTGPRTRAKKKR